MLDKEHVELRVESILIILVQALDRSFLAKVLFDDAHNRLLHSLFQNVVLARLVNLIEELLLSLFVAIDLLLGGGWDLSLLFKVTLEHSVVLSRECLDCNGALLAKVICSRL